MRSRRFGARELLAVACAVAVLIACRSVVPRQGWSERWGPLVPHETFPASCGLCHTSKGWSELRESLSFDHEKETGYALEGSHAEAACLRCHNDRGPVSVYVAKGCGGCHVDPHRSSLGLECERCHDQESWHPGGLVSEHATTRFPLTGRHLTVPCEGCHPRSAVREFRGAPVECHLCHQDDIARPSVLDHVAAGLVNACERCHATAGWGGPDDHPWPNRGVHDRPCQDCHPNGTDTFTCTKCH